MKLLNDELIARALACVNAGISVIPVHAGEKRPALPQWKQYQDERAEMSTVVEWFTRNPDWGLGLVCGQVSGGLEMLELEGRAAHLEPEIAELAEASGLGELFKRIANGWTEQSPTGGVHYFYRIDRKPTPGNTRLAQTDERKVLAETRGEGGFVVIAPTDGTHHATGVAWTARTGSPSSMPVITGEEHEALWDIFKAFNEYAPPKPVEPAPPTAIGTSGVKPGDDFDAKTAWAEILEPHGWAVVFQRGGTVYWRRPGKNKGVSATTGHAKDRDRFYVFSSSTEFTPEKPYTKFAAYTLLNHGGDYREAARALSAEGYGQPAKKILQKQHLSMVPTVGQALSDGNTAIEPQHPVLELVVSIPRGSQDYEAREFVEQYRDRLCYCPEWGKWVAWNGTIWVPQDIKTGGIARELMKEYLRSLPDDSKEERAYKTKVLSDGQISARLNMARTDREIVHRESEFDQHPFELNTPGGIVSLSDSELSPSVPERLHTKTTGVTPDFDMKTPLWDKFLAQTFKGDQEAIGYMQRLAGYSATGELQEHVLPFLYGSGGNGKSVFLEVVLKCLGGYATVAPPNFLMVKNKNDETEFTVLIGKRLVVCSEVNTSSRFDEQRLKQLTGDATIPARFLYGESFTFTASHTLWLVGNHKPKITAGGESIWRRLQLVGFNYTVPREEQIKNLSERLFKEEGAGILAWIIIGAVEYFAVNGLYPPQTVIQDTLEYEEEEDAIARFVEQCLIIGGGEYVRVSSADMNARYRAWCSAENEKEISATALARELRGDKYRLGKARNMNTRYFTNVTLANTGEDEPGDPFRDLGGGL